MTGELAEHLKNSRERILRKGLSVTGQKELPYGVQLMLTRGEHRCAVNLYHSKKKGCSAVGSGGDTALLGEVLAVLSETPTSLHSGGTRTGTDEAGKGDYFGPLVASAVCCGEETARQLVSMGAGDSKRLSKPVVRNLYERITEMAGVVYSVCVVQPEEYNSLFSRFSAGGMNSLDIQAMAHGKALSAVLEKVDGTGRVVIDRFCDMKRLKPWLPSGLEGVELLVRAEDKEPAVAAASIIARSVYLDHLKVISRRYSLDIRPGAGEQIDATGRRLVQLFGEGVLVETAKVHFSNTRRITGRLDRS